MKVLLDHNAPKGLLRHLSAHEAKHTSQLGWQDLFNGDLLNALEANGYRVLITADQNIEYQNTLAGRPIGLLQLSTNNWPIMQTHIAAIVQTVDQVKPGEVLKLFCGKFRRRQLADPLG